jgi:hypothetical protein
MTYTLIANRMTTLTATMNKKNFPITTPFTGPNARPQQLVRSGNDLAQRHDEAVAWTKAQRAHQTERPAVKAGLSRRSRPDQIATP